MGPSPEQIGVLMSFEDCLAPVFAQMRKHAYPRGNFTLFYKPSWITERKIQTNHNIWYLFLDPQQILFNFNACFAADCASVLSNAGELNCSPLSLEAT